MFILSLPPQVRSGIPAYALQTVLKVCVVPGTFGLASVSLCCGRDRFAHNTGARGTMAWSCSSAAPAMTDSAAGCCESPDPGLHRSLLQRLSRWSRLRRLLRLVTPPPTHRYCHHPPSRHLQWQKPDFTCVRRTKGGCVDGLKDRRKEIERMLKGSPSCVYQLGTLKKTPGQWQLEGGVNSHTCLHLWDLPVSPC